VCMNSLLEHEEHTLERLVVLSLIFAAGYGILLPACLALRGEEQAPLPAVREAEKRFPPLQVPQGFKATLFACDPLIEYPSVLALGPKAGSIFLAHDYMTGLGTEIVRRDEIRIVEDSDGDGYADKSTVYAGGFNSIQGLAYHEGRVFAMHAPFLTSLRDANGDGVVSDGTADERRDLLRGIGWPPEEAPDRLHCANGVVAGHDGWLYLALGDRGCDVVRPEGDRLVLQGGGILRCRPDGTDLHVFATGLRNIYDIALDEDLNVFVRDNENDGGTYMVRVYRSFFGADHGYPYLYEEHPGEALPPLADLGRGSSAGGVCYLECAFPAEYQGDLFFCEWGRSVVRYRRNRNDAELEKLQEIELASGAPGDPYGFKPTDIIVDRDGSLLVADWADGQRPKRGRGRVYRISHEGQTAPVPPGLDSPSYHARIEAQAALERRGAGEAGAAIARAGALGRLHAVWAIARTSSEPVPTLLGIAESDADPRVRAQAVRAIADRTDPVLVGHRLSEARGDPAVARKLAALGRGQDPRVELEVVIALGRLRWAEAPRWLLESVQPAGAALAHAVQWTLKRAQSWASVLEWLDLPEGSLHRPIALRALAECREVGVVDGLLRRLETSPDPRRRLEYVGLLARVWRKPGPWVYWGFRPGPRPPNSVAWERTSAIETAFDRVLLDPDHGVRAGALALAQREEMPLRLGTLLPWLRRERDTNVVAALLKPLQQTTSEAARETLLELVRDRAHAVPNRLAALDLILRASDRTGTSGALLELLGDPEAPVRAASAAALGQLASREAVDRLLELTRDPDGLVRRRSLEALARLKDPRALEPALAALEKDPGAELAALECLAAVGGPEQAEAVASFAIRSRSLDALGTAVRALERWQAAGAAARVQGSSGLLLSWRTAGPFEAEAALQAVEAIQSPEQVVPASWRRALASGADGRLTFDPAQGDASWLAAAEFTLPEACRAQLLASSSGHLRVWLNGEVVHQRERPGAYAQDSDRFESDLRAGVNRIVVQASAGGSAASPVHVHVRFRRKSALERHERIAQLALKAQGDSTRGRALFQNAEKPGCVRCHRIGELGGRIGPDLTGAGRRFSPVHLLESILEPSRTVAPAYRSTAVRLRDGQVLVGVKLAESASELTLGDAQGQTHVLETSRIEAIEPQEVSIMPEGLEKELSDGEIADLIAFLVSEK